MQNVINDMHLFVAVCRSRNFRRAAAALGIPNSTLSRRVAALEQGLGVKLLNRSSRKFELTEDGEAYLNRIGPLADELLLAHEELRDRKSKPSGHLKISMPHGLATAEGLSWVAEFAGLHPDISYEINTEPTNVDVLADRFDVAIRQDAPVDSQLYIRVAGSFIFYLYASPSYVEKYGEPRRPEDLENFECIRVAASPTSWTLTRDGQSSTVKVKGRFLCDATVLARPLALAGQGIASLLGRTAAADADAGRLVRILPEWSSATVPLLIITPTKLLPMRTRLFVDFISEKIRRFDTLGA